MVRGSIEIWALAAAGLLGAAALGAPLLGVAGWQPLCVGAAAALALLYVVRRVLALEPLLDRPTASGRPPLVFLLLPFAFYLALIPWSIGERAPDGDEPWFLLVTHSIAHDFDRDLANNYRDEDSLAFMPRAIEPQPGDPEGPDGALYSRHGAVLQTVLAPAYRLGGRAGAIVVIAALAALAAWLFLDLTAFSQDARARLIAYLIFGFAAPFLIYSQQIWAEVAAVLLAVAALRWINRLTRHRREPAAGPGRDDRIVWLLLALALALMPALKLRLVLVSAALALICVLRLAPGLRRRGALVLAAVLAPTGALVLWWNRATFGTVLGMHSWSELELYRESAMSMALGLNGLFFDLAYGLVACAPIWLLLFPAAVVAWRHNRRLLYEVALIAAPTVLLVASRSEWYGGWSPPFRYGLVLLPFLALLLVPLFERRLDSGGAAPAAGSATLPGGRRVNTFVGMAINTRRATSRRATVGPATGADVGALPAGVSTLALVLALLSGALAVLYIVEPGWTYNLADGRHHLVHYLEARSGVDFARFLPSATRPRAATWLVPLAAICLALAAGRVRHKAFAAALAAVPALALAVLPVLAGALPTRQVEVESAAVDRTGGNPEPARWTMDRTRYPEAWVLPEGARAEATVIPGGNEVELTVTVRPVRNRPAPLTLVARSGRREIGRLAFPGDNGEAAAWHTRKLPTATWTSGAPLVLEVPHDGGEALPPNGVAVDRVDLRWH